MIRWTKKWVVTAIVMVVLLGIAGIFIFKGGNGDKNIVTDKGVVLDGSVCVVTEDSILVVGEAGSVEARLDLSQKAVSASYSERGVVVLREDFETLELYAVDSQINKVGEVTFSDKILSYDVLGDFACVLLQDEMQVQIGNFTSESVVGLADLNNDGVGVGWLDEERIYVPEIDGTEFFDVKGDKASLPLPIKVDVLVLNEESNIALSFEDSVERYVYESGDSLSFLEIGALSLGMEVGDFLESRESEGIVFAIFANEGQSRLVRVDPVSREVRGVDLSKRGKLFVSDSVCYVADGVVAILNKDSLALECSLMCEGCLFAKRVGVSGGVQ